MLTTNQMQTLAAALRVSLDATVIAALAIRDDVTLANWCNAAANPAQLAWRTSVAPQDADEAADWTTFDSISAGKRDSWSFFLNFPRDYSKNKVRKWITDVWGNATAGSNAEAILFAGTENATNGELIFGGAFKTTGTVTALSRNFNGEIGLTELSQSLNKF